MASNSKYYIKNLIVRMPSSHGGSRRFKSCTAHHNNKISMLMGFLGLIKIVLETPFLYGQRMVKGENHDTF